MGFGKMSSSEKSILGKMSGSGNLDSGKWLREKVYSGKLTSGNGQTGIKDSWALLPNAITYSIY